MDIYGDESAVKDSFRAYVGKLATDGKLFVQQYVDLDYTYEGSRWTYGIDGGDVKAYNFRTADHHYLFDIQMPDGSLIESIQLMVPGHHNAENATAAAAICWSLGLTAEEIKSGIASYEGVKRRFEYHIRSKECVYIDDYAHHPTEVAAFIESVKTLYPNDKVAVVFQPHLYTRTRDFAEGFAESLSLADEVILMDIYPARELPIEGVTAQLIYDRITTAKKWVKEEDLLNEVGQLHSRVVATVGAGNIDRFVLPIKELLTNK